MVIVNDPSKGAGVRALVIGLGNYPALSAYGLGHLGSPAISAVTFAQWLHDELNYPDKPLRYLDLMVSPDPGSPAAITDQLLASIRGIEPHWQFESCRMAALTTAVQNWAAQLDLSANEVGMLYFCGHGVYVNGVTALLAEDFDAVNQDFSMSIDLTGLHAATARFAAGDDYFFVDACRSTPASMIGLGITPSPVLPREIGRVHLGDSPIYYATRLGANSYGAHDQVSQFTDALLRALRGAGAARGTGAMWRDWEVSSLKLFGGIDTVLDVRRRLGQIKPQEPPAPAGSSDKTIHRLAPESARVPVFLDWKLPQIVVSFSGPTSAPLQANAPPLSCMDWPLSNRMPLDNATIAATDPGQSPKNVQPTCVPLQPPAIDYLLDFM